MNYYIQGDAAKADKIKAAFERLGSDATGWKFDVGDGFYYTHDGRIDLALGKFLINLIKTHPYYQELPIEPKFKVGDWIVQNDNGTVSQITKVINGTDEHGEYHAYEHTNGYFQTCFENEYHLWSIADARDGDVITNGKLIVIFNKLEEPAYKQHIIAYVGLDLCDRLQITEDTWQLGVDKAMPATKEQRDLLFTKMWEAGYQWDTDKKELRKIQPHYDISNFKPFDKVLVRHNSTDKWKCGLFSHLCPDRGAKFVCVGAIYSQCIPFNDDTKHLLGTTNQCEEEYINW